MLLSLLSVAETFYFLDVSVDTYLMGFIGCKNDVIKDSWYVNVFKLMIISRLNVFFFFLTPPTFILSNPKWFLEVSRKRWDGGGRGGGMRPMK